MKKKECKKMYSRQNLGSPTLAHHRSRLRYILSNMPLYESN